MSAGSVAWFAALGGPDWQISSSGAAVRGRAGWMVSVRPASGWQRRRLAIPRASLMAAVGQVVGVECWRRRRPGGAGQVAFAALHPG